MSGGCNCHDDDGQSAAPVMGVLERPRYTPGLILEDSDLTAAVDYTRGLNRLLFRSLFGCGVICGLDVTVKEDCDLVVTVNPGVGLDGCGDPIHLTGQARIRLGKRDGVLTDDESAPRTRNFWITACNREKYCAPRTLVCDGDDLDCSSQPTRIRSGVEVSVSFETPKCGCRCGTFPENPNAAKLDRIAKGLRDGQRDEWEEISGDYAERCHEDHYKKADCAPDCGCGSACSCGCCILLGWAHWSDDEPDRGWQVYHFGVRRFVRPALIPDPRRDFAGPTVAQAGPMFAGGSKLLEQIVTAQMEQERAAQAKEGGGPLDREALARLAAGSVAMELRRLTPRLVEEVTKPAAGGTAGKAGVGQAATKDADPKTKKT